MHDKDDCALYYDFKPLTLLEVSLLDERVTAFLHLFVFVPGSHTSAHMTSTQSHRCLESLYKL